MNPLPTAADPPGSRMTPWQRVVIMGCLIIAGEAIFSLPFHVARFFRSSVLTVFDFTNTELGAAQAGYGITAMIAYLFGGPIADRFQARKLLAASLASTALGGAYYATFPPYGGMAILFGYWGFSTILLFWGALIRATRDWGGSDEQGRAYGILDGGRGLLAALMASGAAVLFAFVFPEDPTSVTPEQEAQALRLVIYAYAAITLAAAALVWFFVPDNDVVEQEHQRQHHTTRDLLVHVWGVARRPAVWLQALIVVAAYVAYKGFDNYQLYAVQVWGMTKPESAMFTANMQWVRPFAALGAGLLGDRLGCSRLIIAFFAMLVGADAYFAVSAPAPDATWILTLNVLVTCVAMFGLRGIYFALFEEGRVPIAVTGTAVGIVSFIGYTPDVFVSYVAGIILDASPGLAGFQNFFWFLCAFAGVGLIATIAFQRACRVSVP